KASTNPVCGFGERTYASDARRDFSEKRAEHRLAPADDVGRAARDCSQLGRAPGAESGTHSLVSKQSARAVVALSFRAEGSGILLHAPKESGARSCDANEGIARAWRSE